ncbi:hypothetical protein [Jiangella sp. DSM 45060]|uniref:hypothetical protein n=1 Tax=Jiangella sp. DSM 45060 TaxID=1798224 RepID=UPI00087D819F|nr:hypothetical protein [Jiangella sp. DSM 45060]SDT71875.1 hypothetical protein SAMN04515669_6525 [Jiangella sp. DSM 45060]
MTPEQQTVFALDLLRTEVASGGFDCYSAAPVAPTRSRLGGARPRGVRDDV